MSLYLFIYLSIWIGLGLNTLDYTYKIPHLNVFNQKEELLYLILTSKKISPKRSCKPSQDHLSLNIFTSSTKEPIRWDSYDLFEEEEFEGACGEGVFLTTGTCSVFTVANLSMERGHIVENVVAVILLQNVWKLAFICWYSIYHVSFKNDIQLFWYLLLLDNDLKNGWKCCKMT